MNPHKILRLFPGASKSLLAANATDYGTGAPIAARTTSTRKEGDELCAKIQSTSTTSQKLGSEEVASNGASVVPSDAAPSLVLCLTGQIRGGKNNMGVTKSGRHYPRPTWAKWRDAAVWELRAQLPSGWKSIKEPVSVRLDYTAGDRKRRDQPAVLDAIFHCLEKAGVVEDDTFLWVAQSTRAYSANGGKAIITIYS